MNAYLVDVSAVGVPTYQEIEETISRLYPFFYQSKAKPDAQICYAEFCYKFFSVLISEPHACALNHLDILYNIQAGPDQYALDRIHLNSLEHQTIENDPRVLSRQEFYSEMNRIYKNFCICLLGCFNSIKIDSFKESKLIKSTPFYMVFETS